MEQLILNKAKQLFFSYGLRTITMDDIARSAGVSKKTIYQHFSNKNEVLDQVVRAFLQCYRIELERSKAEAKDAVEELVITAGILAEMAELVNQHFFYELEKSFPETWELITGFTNKAVRPAIIENLQRGIRTELYRADLDINFLTEIRLQQMRAVFNPKSFSNKQAAARQLSIQLTEFFLQAIVTTKGKKLINKYLNVNNEKRISN